MRPLMKLSVALAVAGLGAHAQAGKITPELEARMRLEADTEVLVYFEESEPALAESASQADVLRRLQRNMRRSKAIVEGELGFAAGEKVRATNWIANAISMTVDASEIKDIARHPAVKRVLWDAPVYPAETVAATTDRPESEPYTYGLKKLGVDKVREQLGITGQGVLLGNIDTGVDGNHPDVGGKIVGYLDPSGTSTEPTDTHGHGTHTAGTMVGQATSGTSIGVAPDADLLVARGIAGSSTLTNLLTSMGWMLDPDGDPSTNDAPVVVSMSWHSGGGDQTPFYEAIQAMTDAGVIANFSAGNSGNSGLTHPKEYPTTVTNAASDSNDNIASFSSRGPAVYNGEEQLKPEWACPGVDVYSAKPGGGYQNMSGTSMAAPHGAGVIGLLFQAAPDLTPAQVREVLIETAVDLGEPGWDPAFGFGRVDAFAAVSLVASGGKVLGKVKDADGAAISYAQVEIVERDFTVNVKDDGGFKLLLPEGDYTLVVSAFGYLPVTASVSVVKDGEVQMDVALEQAEVHEVHGNVNAKEGGQGLQARVQVLGTPLPAFDTAADGHFHLNLPEGEYTVQVLAFGYKVTSKSVVVPDGDANFELDPLPPILVVDDDAGKSYEGFYQAALADLGMEFGVMDSSAAMDDQTLLPYETVIWFTGDDYNEVFSASQKAQLKAFLANGGKLILSGQDVGYGLRTDAFYGEVLKAKYVKDSSGVKALSGLGMDLSIEGGDGANNQKYPDVIEALEGAEAIFQYAEDKGVAGLKVADSIAYLAFGFEAVSTAEARAALMGKLLGLLHGDAEVDSTSAAVRGVARRQAFGQLHD